MEDRQTTYFASGSNLPAEIRGFAAIGFNVGVAANRLSPAGEKEILSLAGSGIKVFVDSGAFSEVMFKGNIRCVVKPISEDDWERRLSLYRRIAARLGPSTYLVAPDCVGDQGATLGRLRRYSERLRELVGLGARVLLPIQRGPVPQRLFVSRCEDAVGFEEFTHALPCKKDATTTEELVEYVSSINVRRLHLLGLGVKNRKFGKWEDIIYDALPDVDLSCDSCLITANVGRGNGRRGGPRLLTKSLALAKKHIVEGCARIKDPKELSIIYAFGKGRRISGGKMLTSYEKKRKELQEMKELCVRLYDLVDSFRERLNTLLFMSEEIDECNEVSEALADLSNEIETKLSIREQELLETCRRS